MCSLGTEIKDSSYNSIGIHAREWITPATTTYFINQLLTSENPKIQNLRNNFDWHIFPSVNPDGYHYSYTRVSNYILHFYATFIYLAISLQSGTLIHVIQKICILMNKVYNP